MNWILASILMFISSVILYLAIRKAQLQKISIQTYSLFMFGIPIIGLIILSVITNTSFSVTPLQFFYIFIAALFFSYLGNVFSQKSILYASNPGYALVISKSYVVFTTIVAVAFFKSEITLKSTLAILCIVIFSALIMVGKNAAKTEHKNQSWLLYSFGAFFCWGFLALMSTFLLNTGLNVYIYVLS